MIKSFSKRRILLPAFFCALVTPQIVYGKNLLSAPNELCSSLLTEGFTVISPWEKQPWKNYSCSSQLKRLNDEYLTPSNITFYAESEKPDQINLIRLSLNINDSNYQEIGKQRFIVLLQALFARLSIVIPPQLINSITTEEAVNIPLENGVMTLDILLGATHTINFSYTLNDMSF